MKRLLCSSLLLVALSGISACSLTSKDGGLNGVDTRTQAGSKKEVTFYEERPDAKKSLIPEGLTGIFSRKNLKIDPLCGLVESTGLSVPGCPKTENEKPE